MESLSACSVCQRRSRCGHRQRSNNDVIPADDPSSRGPDDRRNGREEISKRSSSGNSLSDSEKLKFSSPLEEGFRRNSHPQRTGCLDEPDGNRPVQNDEPGFTTDGLAGWFCNGAAATRTASDFSSCDRKRRKVEPDPEGSQQRRGLPLLPNRNAVYLVQPLPPDTSNDPESVEVVLRPPSETERSVSSSSMSSSFRDEVHAEPLQGKGGPDVNHNTAGPLPDQATDLRLTNRAKNESSKSPFDWKSLASSWPHHEHPSLLWPARHFGADPEILSESPSPKGILPDPLHNLHPSSSSASLSMPFLYPHYPVARMPPLAPNAIQLAAMSQLFRHSVAAAAFYGSTPATPAVFPHRASATAAGMRCDPGEDQGSSPGSNPGESERRKRSRVFIDPNTEIPRLEEWYRVDTHPSAVQIERYTGELNAAEYRRRFPRLETKNVQLWFKNHRAKVKRLTLDEDDSNGSGCGKAIASDEETFPRHKSAFSSA